MAGKEDRRSALVPADFIILIGPNGTLRKVTQATNMRSMLVMQNGDETVLTKQAAQDGWLRLSDQVDEATYSKIYAHLKAEQLNPHKCDKFDERLLPKVCKDRVKASLKASSRPGKKVAVDEAQLRAQIKGELMGELKAGLKAELLAEVRAEIAEDAKAG